MLWFSMMLMPTGPPAMILVALTDVTGAPEKMKMTIAKFLTVSFLPSRLGHWANQMIDQLCNYSTDLLCCRWGFKSHRSGD